jgi:predicted metal-dependent hydrolase
LKSEVGYSFIRSRERKKTLSLRIMPDGNIVIRAPHRTPKEEIESFFQSKQDWVRKKLREKEDLSLDDSAKTRKFVSGEQFLYLGEFYPLEIESKNGRKTALTLSWSRFILDEERAEEARALFIKWYQAEAKRLFANRVDHYSKKFSLFAANIKITSAECRYGSCSPVNNLSFTWRLVMAPLAVIDYVIIHELVHTKVKNHSRTFWESVASAMPDYKAQREWLRRNNHLLRV